MKEKRYSNLLLTINVTADQLREELKDVPVEDYQTQLIDMCLAWDVNPDMLWGYEDIAEAVDVRPVDGSIRKYMDGQKYEISVCGVIEVYEVEVNEDEDEEFIDTLYYDTSASVPFFFNDDLQNLHDELFK